jgi:hypothetical protein
MSHLGALACIQTGLSDRMYEPQHFRGEIQPCPDLLHHSTRLRSSLTTPYAHTYTPYIRWPPYQTRLSRAITSSPPMNTFTNTPHTVCLPYTNDTFPNDPSMPARPLLVLWTGRVVLRQPLQPVLMPRTMQQRWCASLLAVLPSQSARAQ